MDDATLASFSAIIVPSAMVADRLRYTEDINKLPPATEFLKRAFAERSILKGIIWPRLVAGGSSAGAGARPEGSRSQQSAQ